MLTLLNEVVTINLALRFAANVIPKIYKLKHPIPLRHDSGVILGFVSISRKVVMLGETTFIPRGAMPAHLPVLAVHPCILFARGEQ